MPHFSFPKISYHWLVFATALFIVCVLNDSFNATFTYYASLSLFAYLHYVFIPIHTLMLFLALEIITARIYCKILLSFVLFIASVCAYYADSLGVVIDEDIIASLFATNAREAGDMINFGLIKFLCIYAILPSVVIWIMPLKRDLLKRKWAIIFAFSLAFGAVYVECARDVIFVFKAYKPLASMPNPIAPIRSLILYIQHSKERDFRHFLIAQDATLKPSTPPQIILFVIGESARAANYTLNGYERETNPYTKNLPLISFKNFYSCGVITAISVPCLLTHYTRDEYTHRNLALYVNNILDIAKSVGYDVWYLGNNGGGCVGECDRNITNKIIYPSDSLDGVMLGDLERVIADSTQNIFIVMHLYGSHGASYFKRYPLDFQVFSPVCEDKELSKCDRQSIVNAYDNSLIYTDYILAQSIDILTRVNPRSMLWYVSDHGESLGEMGQYMHGGLGYTLAPSVQKHIPSIMWFSRGFEAESKRAKEQQNAPLSHDNVFHTLLGILGIETEDYDKNLDILGD